MSGIKLITWYHIMWIGLVFTLSVFLTTSSFIHQAVLPTQDSQVENSSTSNTQQTDTTTDPVEIAETDNYALDNERLAANNSAQDLKNLPRDLTLFSGLVYLISAFSVMKLLNSRRIRHFVEMIVQQSSFHIINQNGNIWDLSDNIRLNAAASKMVISAPLHENHMRYGLFARNNMAQTIVNPEKLDLKLQVMKLYLRENS